MWFDRRCPGCRHPARLLCPRCRARLASSRPAGDDVLGRPPPGVDRLAVLFPYQGLVADLILAAKNGGRRPLLHLFGSWLALAVVAGGAGPVDGAGGVDGVTWVPASRSRRRRRGYDQSRVLAAAAARGLGVDLVPALRRVGGGAQAGRPREERLIGPRLRVVSRVPHRVLLVDDVVTTGSSLRVAAEALRAAGASSVSGAVVAVAVAGPSVPPTVGGERDGWAAVPFPSPADIGRAPVATEALAGGRSRDRGSISGDGGHC